MLTAITRAFEAEIFMGPLLLLLILLLLLLLNKH